MKLFHRTTKENARLIIQAGFRDSRGRYMTGREHSGVWVSDDSSLSNEPLDESTSTLLSLEIDERRIAEFEWLEEGKTYREWLVPAAVLNSASTKLSVEISDEE